MRNATINAEAVQLFEALANVLTGVEDLISLVDARAEAIDGLGLKNDLWTDVSNDLDNATPAVEDLQGFVQGLIEKTDGP